MALLIVLFLCEVCGYWPQHSSLVVIALLAKAGGGLRPIGLFPWLPKVWAKLRRGVAAEWEIANDRSYLYGGAGRGADHATWKQSAWAEHAAITKDVHFGMTFFDPVKAFDRVPHGLLVQEAIRLGYSLWVLRLSVSAYSAQRIIRVDGVYSRLVTPKRSITAGSAFAITEVRLVLIHIIDTSMRAAPPGPAVALRR